MKNSLVILAACLLLSGPLFAQELELPPAICIDGTPKEKYLLRAGTKILGGIGDFYHPEGIAKGSELGSVAKVRKPFLIKDILFSLAANHIPGCVAAINIYRIEGEPEEFVNILHRPIYIPIPESAERQDFDIQPEESILLEPGRYFIAFGLVDCDQAAVQRILDTPEPDRAPLAMHLHAYIYFKSSYQRFTALSKAIHIPVNIGIAVKGLEYQ
ncbi:MAG: hypothetical protein IKX34_04040 [Bacteroidales bacterium]|nr:hypothetical protein [Bacteroidales bacterium]